MFRDILSDFPLLEDRLFHPENKEAINSFFAGEMKVSQLLRTKTFTLPQETLQVLRAVVEIFEEEKEGNRKEIEEEVKAVCKKDDLVILMNMLPHITTLMEWTLKQETSFRVVTHGDFHQWNLAFNSEALFDLLKQIISQVTPQVSSSLIFSSADSLLPSQTCGITYHRSDSLNEHIGIQQNEIRLPRQKQGRNI